MKKVFSLLIAATILVSGFTVPAYAATYKTNQDCTAYLWSGKKMANEEWPEIGDVAVHPKVKNTHTNPIIPFGTILYIDSIAPHNGTSDTMWFSPVGEITALRVGDLGNVAYTRSTYWVDLYYGTYTTDANNWGIGRISYHYN